MKTKPIELGIRKIQKISKAHYINLPFIWMHTNNARQGDKLELSIGSDGSLRIAPAHPAKNDAGVASRFGASHE